MAPPSYPSRGAWRFRNVTRAFDFWPMLESVAISAEHPDMVSALTCRVVDPDAALAFAVEDEVVVTFRAERLWAGHLKSVGQDQLSEVGPRVWDLAGQDYTAKLDDAIVRRRRKRKKTKHERGGHNGADPFGYRAARDDLGGVVQPHRLEVVPAEAELVRRVFDRYGAGDVSQGGLAEALRAEGLGRRGRPWVEKGVQDILRRADLYLGKAVYRRGQDVREGTQEPIITPAQAHLARQTAARRQRSTSGRRQPGRVYLLAQLLHCACGARMRGETQRRRGREAEWRYYRCPGRRDGRCASGGWRVRADAVEAIVLDHLAAHRTPPEELPYCARSWPA